MADPIEFFTDERSPFDKRFTLAVGQRLPALRVQLLSERGQPIDITGATVTFSMKDRSGAYAVQAGGASVENANEGIVSYAWTVAAVDMAGVYFGQFTITIGGVAYLVPNNETQKLIVTIGDAV